MNKKRNIIVVICVALVLIIIICILLFYKGKKNYIDENSGPNVNYNKKELKNLGNYSSEEDLKNHLMSYYSSFNKCDTGVDFNYGFDNQAFTAYDFSNNTIYNLAINYILTNKKYIKNNETYKISKTEMNNAIKALFGKEFASSFVLGNTFDYKGSNFTLNKDNYEGKISDSISYCNKYISTRYSYFDYGASDEGYYIIYGVYWTNRDEQNGKPVMTYYYNSDYATGESSYNQSKLEKFVSYNFILEDGEYILKDITDATPVR